MIPLPDLTRMQAMRQQRHDGWSYQKIGVAHGLSVERTMQLLKRDPMEARVYGPWVVFNDIPFLVMCRPNKEARMKAYRAMRRADPNYQPRQWGTFTQPGRLGRLKAAE